MAVARITRDKNLTLAIGLCLGDPQIPKPDMLKFQLEFTTDHLVQKGAKVVGFDRLVGGEGIEKKEENFAEEVMAQVSGG